MATAELREPEAALTKEQQVEGWIREATEARESFEIAGAEYARYVTKEAELEAERPFVKQEVVTRLMTKQNLAATPAEKWAATDASYVEHLAAQRDVVAKKNDACTRMISARLRAELAIAAVRSIAGLI